MRIRLSRSAGSTTGVAYANRISLWFNLLSNKPADCVSGDRRLDSAELVEEVVSTALEIPQAMIFAVLTDMVLTLSGHFQTGDGGEFTSLLHKDAAVEGEQSLCKLVRIHLS